MGHIKEEKGVDLLIEETKITSADKKAISEFIKSYKEKLKADKPKLKRVKKESKLRNNT
jgi:tRNA A-37 threonylcarbamoyl transferase component Bud32